MASGDPHYSTYDRGMIHFQGACVYTATRSVKKELLGGLEPFDVESRNVHLNGQTHVTYLDALYITVYGTEYSLEVESHGKTRILVSENKYKSIIMLNLYCRLVSALSLAVPIILSKSWYCDR